MKKFRCYECDHEVEAESRDDILSKLYDHYMTDHPTIIPNATDAEKKAWMEQFEKDWTEAETVG